VNKPLNIVILGGGTAGWMAAAGLTSLVSPSACRIQLIESDEIGTVGVGEATLPHIKNFNDTIGVDEAEIMRATGATFKLGIEFVDWGFEGSRYIHPFGTYGRATSGSGFHHRWLRARGNGWQSSIEDLSYAIVAARRNRFDFPEAARPTINSTYSYAYHLDASLYAQQLRLLAQTRGVKRTEGKVRDVVQDSETGNVRSLVLESGERVDGDFFIDCSGFRSLLLGSKLGVAWEDWSKWLPCDRAFAVPSERASEMTPFTRSTAAAAGWRWRIPLQNRTGNGYVFSSAFIGDDEAAGSLMDNLDTRPLGEPRLLRFQAGRRVNNWEKNCVALGLASGFLEPLESTSIYLIQVAIMHLLPLIPLARQDQRLADEFNRKMNVEYDRIRDFLILHYHLTRRDDSEIWRYCANMDVPDSLKSKMELFGRSAQIEQYRDGLFTLPSWLAVYLGQGLIPAGYSPLADNGAIERLVDDLEDLRTEISDRVDEMPKHDRFVARYCEAPEQHQLVTAEARL
jgi:tryptophan 7-halogenase